MNCLFCRIVAGEIPASTVYEDADLLAFKDINPQAPLHVLIVPKRHVATLNDLVVDDDRVLGAMVRRAAAIAEDEGYSGSGYRVVLNCNAHAGQTVFHVHLHVLGGRAMGWPPG
jgi:histidine triad (HIT) family protein